MYARGLRWFRDRTIATKLYAAAGLVAAVAVVVGTTSLQRLAALRDDAVEIEADLNQSNLLALVRGGALYGLRAELEHALAPVGEAKEEAHAKFVEAADTWQERWQDFADTRPGDEDITSYTENLGRWRELALGEYADLSAAGRIEEAMELRAEQLTPIIAEMTKSLENVIGELDEETSAVTADARDAYSSGRTLTLLLLVGGLLLAGVAVLVITRMVSRPLRRSVEVLDRVAAGDLTQRLEVDSADEVGLMADALNRSLESTEAAMSRIAESATTLAASSEELTSVSATLGVSSEEASAQAGSVSAAAEQVSANVTTVASGAEELGASIREIAGNAHEAARVAADAAEVASSTNATVTKLGDSSAEIGEVIKVITSIAEQTNLLALNATIEAARAGEAGKGFAVVANEVKELASETARATEDIGRKVGAIQDDAQAAVAAIGRISEVIGQINDLQGTIASAVEEQTATTGEISRSVAEAATGASDIATTITGVASAAQETSGGASDVLSAAEELAHLADELGALVAGFVVSATAAARPGRTTDPTPPAPAPTRQLAGV